jgi:hypothetical protein
MDLEEEEASKSKAKRAPSKKLKESTGVSGEEYCANEGEKEGA